MDKSIGIGVPLGPVAELANPVNRPGTDVALGADQAQQPHEIVWALRDPYPDQMRNQHAHHTPRWPSRIASRRVAPAPGVGQPAAEDGDQEQRAGQ
ncbi:MAG: hypothetical protein ACRDYV_13360 [Acidimicrobiia bacterium]